MIRAFYLPPKGGRVVVVDQAETIVEMFRRREGLMWIDIEGAVAEELSLLSTGFRFHPVSVDICREVTTQPLVYDYDEYLMMVTHAVDFTRSNGDVATIEVDVFCSQYYVLTYHSEMVRSITDLRQHVQASGSALLSRGSQFFVHALLDRIIDNFGPTMEAIDDAIDDLEAEIFRRPNDAILHKILSLKRKVAYLGRVAAAQRDAIGRIARGEFPQISKQALVYWRDLYDHLVRMVQATDVQRDMISSARDTYLSVVSNRMNEVMKVLTVIATIFIPMTFVAGVYGMNFHKGMLELEWRYGYLAFWIVNAVIAVGMLVWFRRRKWL